MVAREKIIRVVITLNVVVLGLFHKIRRARINQTFIRVAIMLGSGLSDGHQTTETATKKRRRSCGGCERLVRESARSNLPRIEAYVQLYYSLSLVLNWYLMLKNLIVCLLRNDALAPYRYLDCYLLGRYLINGRVIEVAPDCASYDAAVRLFWCYTFMAQRREFRLPCLEFLLHRREHEPFWARALGQQASKQSQGERHSSLLEYKNQFDARARAPCRLRPNRTRAAWDALARETLAYYCTLASLSLVLVALFAAMGLPVGITRSGFTQNYRHCIEWVRDSRAGSVDSNRSTIYKYFAEISAITRDTNSTFKRPIGNFFMPYTELVELTSGFHLLRVGLELFETSFLLAELGLMLTAANSVAVIMCKDILYYSRAINRRLARVLVAVMEAEVSSTPGSELQRAAYYDSLYLERTRVRYPVEVPSARMRELSAELHHKSARLEGEITDIQAQIADMFAQLDAYNSYLSLQSACQLAWWLSYAALVSSWIFLPGLESPKLEWYCIHAYATLYLIVMLANTSAVKCSCQRMHRLMASLMARDENYTTSKREWAALTRFYAPKPMHCFTMGASGELTLLAGLKLLIWLVSCFIVASSFFRVYNIK